MDYRDSFKACRLETFERIRSRNHVRRPQERTCRQMDAIEAVTQGSKTCPVGDTSDPSAVKFDVLSISP